MKTILLILIIFCLMLLICACDPGAPKPSPTPNDLIDLIYEAGNIEPTATPILNIPAPTIFKPDEPLSTPLPAPSPTPLPTPTLMPTPTPLQNPNMYDSDALFVSFDPNTGIAQFDYIVILQGEAAVEYMVSVQGKTEQEAQDIVDDWADSECIIKNDNPQLRYVDMTDTAITMLFYPDGTEDYTLSGVSFSYNDFLNLYNNFNYRINHYLFYHIDVNNAGEVVEVRQVYWP